MAARKTGRRTQRNSSRRPAKKAGGRKPRPAAQAEANEENEENEENDDDQSERRPRKPKQEIVRASMFAVVTSVEIDDQQTKDQIVDVFFDEGSAEVVAESIKDADEVFVDPVEVLLIKTKVPGSRGQVDVDCFVLDRAAPQPLTPEASEFAGAALTRKRALAKLTPDERLALGLPAEIGEAPSKPARNKSNGRGTVDNPATPETSNDVHEAEDTAPDPFA